LSLTIRSEQLADYSAIAEIHAMAFTYSEGMGETVLVDVLRHRPRFDPDLSLAAIEEGNVVGHLLLTPRRVMVGGLPQNAVILSPVAVHPRHQGRGIGGQLIREAHRRALAKGYDFSLLLGHPDYYPRFSYRTHMYGTCGVAIERDAIPPLQVELTERRVTEDDVAAFTSMWHQWFHDVDLAIVPEATMLDWLSPSKTVKAVAVWNGSHRIGYVRYRTDEPHKVLSFLSADVEASMQLISYLGSKLPRDSDDPLFLPVHPQAQATRTRIPLPVRADVRPWAAGMVCPLNPANHAIQQYCDEVARGMRSIGLVIWPVEFDVC
jgi:putative acetyltransferase